jgi:molecular chaperone DnaK
MGAVVGIDLGTTNTVVAAMRDGKPVAICDETGSSLIPSIVSFLPSGAVLVGNAAKERRSQDTKNTVYSVKRLIGRPWDSLEVREARNRFSFELKEGPGRATFVVARNETFTLPEISAYVLRKARSIAEIELGESVDRAVVTVPASFNDLQRAATKVAGRVAGLEVLRILNEPTAAALAYGHNQGTAKNIAVFDFGGGTFDITLLSLTQSVFEVLATSGNTFLGGDDIDWAIAEKMADEFSAFHGRDIRDNPAALEPLRLAAEAIKIQLVSAQFAEISVDVVLDSGGASLPLLFAMSRAEFEQLATPILDRAFKVCSEAVSAARIGIDDIDHVLLVGGGTRIPSVRKRVEEYFKRQPEAHLDPHNVVALGAALQAHSLTTARLSTGRMEVPPAPLPSANRIDTTSSTEWRQKTQPFGRLGSTDVGIGQRQSPDISEHIQVAPPDDVQSRPIPTTKHLGSRGRFNTEVGIGPKPGMGSEFRAPLDTSLDERTHEDELEPEELLPVVASTAMNSRVVSDAADALADSDDDEETVARAFFEPAIDSNPSPQTPAVNLRSEKTDGEAQTDDITVRVQRTDAGSTASQLPAAIQDKSALNASQGVPTDSDLPAILASNAKDAARRQSPASVQDTTVRQSRAPSADELRQRYGDLPLIIGGKRLGTRPSENPDQPAELPAVRPTLDTKVDGALATDFGDESLPEVRPLNVSRKTIPDSNIHTELPLVGVGAIEHRDMAYPAPAPPRPRHPPAAHDRLGSPVTTPTSESAGNLPHLLSDADLIEEPRSQPPSTARLSARPAMRPEPVAEAALPVPNLPDWSRQADFEGQRSTAAATARGSSPLSASSTLARPVAESLDSRPLYAAGSKAPSGSSIVESRRRATSSHGQGPTAASSTNTGLPPHGHVESALAAQTAAAIPLSNLPSRDTEPSHANNALPRQHYGVGIPLLIDVTPLSLCVETVGSYTDVLIDRNTPVPCERSREFVTVQDGQQVVRVRVAQGESKLFAENLFLGELELTGLRPAPRGQLRISVTFGLDSDGILHVRAIDLDTGRAAVSELRLAGIPTPTDVTRMTSRHQASS